MSQGLMLRRRRVLRFQRLRQTYCRAAKKEPMRCGRKPFAAEALRFAIRFVLENGGATRHSLHPERDVRKNYCDWAHVAVIIPREQIRVVVLIDVLSASSGYS
jgi:hypothetical protein